MSSRKYLATETNTRRRRREKKGMSVGWGLCRTNEGG